MFEPGQEITLVVNDRPPFPAKVIRDDDVLVIEISKDERNEGQVLQLHPDDVLYVRP